MTISRQSTTGGMGFQFPPFHGAVKWLCLINAGLFLVLWILRVNQPGTAALIYAIFGLTPVQVLNGWVWQLLTYSFLHASAMQVIFSTLGLWFIGSWAERSWGTKRFLRVYFGCAVAAAVIATGLAYAGLLGARPDGSAIGSSGAVSALFIILALMFGEQQLTFFPLPITIKGKYMAIVVLVLDVAALLDGWGSLMPVVSICGLLAGFLYVKLLSRQPAQARSGYVGRGLSDRFAHPSQRKPQHGFFVRKYNELRDNYYRWKRRRAARKFEVYMRKHDRSVYFDEYGNYKGTEPLDKKDDGEHRDPWVN